MPLDPGPPVIVTHVPSFFLAARWMAKVMSQSGPPAVKWSRGTDSVMHWKVLSSGHGFATTNFGGVSIAVGPAGGWVDDPGAPDAPGDADAPGTADASGDADADDDPAGEAGVVPEATAEADALALTGG